ncbi:hypothetical protein P8452_71788 [Trifolium repens]|nr:hypothetical protein P8452_71788 [Trifolium repens]
MDRPDSRSYHRTNKPFRKRTRLTFTLFHHLLVSLELPLIFKKNFTRGFGDSKRVDQELQQLIYLTTFRFVTVLCFAYNQSIVCSFICASAGWELPSENCVW